MPSGWPSAIAPPFTFTRSGSRPSSRIDLEALRGERLVQLDQVEIADLEARAREHLPHGRDRADAHDPRIDARDRARDEAAERLDAQLAARSSLAITSAAAPSFTPLEFPAVTVPPSRNAGRSDASFSSVVSGRGCSSRSTSPTGTSSSAKRPASCAAAQRRWLSSANASWSSRETAEALGHVLAGLAHRLEREHRLHLRIREAPAERRVPGRSACPGRRRARPSRRRTARGVIDSAPPATKRSPDPARIAWHASTTAESPDAQSRFTVTPATSWGSPASSAAMRATLRLSSPAWFAAPK